MNQSKSNGKHGLNIIYKVMLLILTLLPLNALAQTKITGTVTDEVNDPIIGATVKIKGASTGVVTDIDGNFTINAAVGQTLEVSYIGYTTHSVKVTRAGHIDVRLSEDTQTLEQVVVVGYGTMKRSDLTGSVASINEEQIKQGVNTSVEQAMQGRIAGVMVTQNSGTPGGGISVQIRGINSFNGNEPLYVVDGIQMSGQTSDNTSVLGSINPADITSVEVLKDASATAIYGSRASNGVVPRVDGAVFAAMFIVFLLLTIRSAKKQADEKEKLPQPPEEEIPSSESAKAPKGGDKDNKKSRLGKGLLFAVIGIAGVVGGGKLVVYSATNIAESFGIDETLIGLTIVAIGTSLPELVTSAVATAKGETDIAVGNVVGSNIFNLLFVLSLSVIVNPITVKYISLIDCMILLGISVLALIIFLVSRRLNRAWGVVFVLLYAAYTAYIILR